MTNEKKYKTAEERFEAFTKWCKQKQKCVKCELFGKISSPYECPINWLALEAEEEKPEPCPFCGMSMGGRFQSLGPSIWYGQCSCGYATRAHLQKAEAVAAHNRVARAVKAALESEVAECEK